MTGPLGKDNFIISFFFSFFLAISQNNVWKSLEAFISLDVFTQLWQEKKCFCVDCHGQKIPNGLLEGSGVIGLILDIKGKLLFASEI